MSEPIQMERPLLMGLPSIAEFLGISERQARHLVGKRIIPVFKLKRSALLCARPEKLREWLAAEEAEALAGQNDGAQQ